MAIPKKHKERVEKFVRIVLEKVVKEEVERIFFRKGKLTDDYAISIYSTGLLPNYNDDTIEVSGDVNGKTIGVFLLPGKSIADHALDDKLVKEIIDAYMTLRIKEIKL
jgi:hypothetical protein